MEVQNRGTKIIPNHALDMIGNPSEACLPPSRPSLTSFALEYGGALRMIRVSIFSIDLNASRGWQGLVYIGRSINPKPLDQTDLNKQRRCNLGGGGEPTFEGEHDMWVPWPYRPAGGVDRPHLAAPHGLLRWCLLESSQVVTIVDKYDLL